MVKFVKKHAPNERTLAVGDGANDVPMIISANVGIGITSKEGNQAANHADYAIPTFQDLRRLIFWHGRSFSTKMTNVMLWTTSRSMIFSIALFFFNLVTGYSGIQPIEHLIYGLINVNITTFAAYFYVLFEVEISFEKYSKSYADEEKMSYSLMDFYSYKRRMSKKFVSQHIWWLAVSFYSGFVIFFVYNGVMNDSSVLGIDG